MPLKALAGPCVRGCTQTVFEQSKAKFDQLLQSGQVLQQYTHVLQLLLRLRQACNHPQLLSYRNDMRRQQVAEGDPFQETLHSDPSEAADSRMPYLSLVNYSTAFSCLAPFKVSGAVVEVPSNTAAGPFVSMSQL